MNISFLLFTSALIFIFGWYHATRHWILTQVFVCYISMLILLLTCNNFFYDEIQSCPNIFFVHLKERYLSRFIDEYTKVENNNLNMSLKNQSNLYFLN